MAILPPDMSASAFESFLTELRNAIGADWVWNSDEDMFPYRDSFSPVWDTDEERHASAAAAPENVEAVQEIVRIAGRYKVPVFPISTGKNFGYGGASPNVHGSVVIDLKRLNQVLEIDDERNFALVEPGVSYFDLYRVVQEKGLKLMVDCPDPGWGGPVGNSLERGIGYTMPQFRDHFGAHCGMEVVLPNGELMRTGMGALPGAETWQEYPYGFGPDPAGLFAQGNFGIVTKMGFRLMPLPEHYRTGLITIAKRQDYIKLVTHVNYLSDSSLIGLVEYTSPLRALMADGAFMALITKRGGPTDEEMDAAASAAGLPSFQVELQFFGPEATTLANWEYAKDRILSDIPGSKAYDGETFPLPANDEQMHNTAQPYPTSIQRHRSLGIPSLDAWKIVSDDGHVGLFPIFPRTGEAVFEVQRVLGDAMLEFPALPPFFNALTMPFFWHSHTFQMVFAPSVKKSDKKHNAMVHRAVKRVVEVAAEHGWGDYRAAPIYQDHVSDTFSFNNHQLRRFHEQLKDSIDPDGIVAPGRGGVWPKRFRK